MIIHIDTSAELLTIDGVQLPLAALAEIVHPDEKVFYSFERVRNKVIVTKYPCVSLPESAIESDVRP